MAASDIIGLHHVGLVVRDLNAAIATFRRLGFHVAPPAYPALAPAPGAEPEPLGAGNTHADFPRTFIELLAPVPDDRELLPADATLTLLQLPDDQLKAARRAMRQTVAGLVERLGRFEGAHILVFASADAEGTAARLDIAGLTHTGARPAQRPITTADGTRLEAIRYLDIHADDATSSTGMPPEGRIGAAQDAPPAVLDAQTGLDHPNGALALTECVLCVDAPDLESTAARYERYLGISAEHADDSHAFDLGGSRLTITAPSGLAARLPGERPPAAPALSAYTVDVADLDAAEQLLRDRGIDIRRAADGGPFIPAAIAHGATIMLRQAPAVADWNRAGPMATSSTHRSRPEPAGQL